MHVNAKVTGLSLQQWDYLRDTLPARYDMPDGVVRVCATFELELGDAVNVRHAEIPIRMFAGLLNRLERHGNLAMAVLTPDALPDTEAGQGPLPGYPDKADDPGAPYRYDQDGNVVALDQYGQS
jgi:hypothetical protein